MSQIIFGSKFLFDAENAKAVWAQAPRVGSFSFWNWTLTPKRTKQNTKEMIPWQILAIVCKFPDGIGQIGEDVDMRKTECESGSAEGRDHLVCQM
jgi:hypothetical protein